MPIDCTLTTSPAGTRYIRSLSHGVVSADDARNLLSKLAGEWAGHFLLACVARGASYPAETRRAFSEPGGNPLSGPLATAVVCESAIQKAVVATILLFVKMPEERPIKLCASEGEALAWIESRSTKSQSALRA